MSVSQQRETTQVCEGTRNYVKDALIDTSRVNEACTLFARLDVAPGSEIPTHQHTGETETYYFLSGKGVYNDNGIEVEVSAGSVTLCEDGQSHGFVNTSDETASLVALILKN